jgi:hypothetical protein
MSRATISVNEYTEWLSQNHRPEVLGKHGHTNAAELVRAHQRLAFASGLLERLGPSYLTELPYETLCTLFIPGDMIRSLRIRILFEKYIWHPQITQQSIGQGQGLPFGIYRLDQMSAEDLLRWPLRDSKNHCTIC